MYPYGLALIGCDSVICGPNLAILQDRLNLNFSHFGGRPNALLRVGVCVCVCVCVFLCICHDLEPHFFSLYLFYIYIHTYIYIYLSLSLSLSVPPCLSPLRESILCPFVFCLDLLVLAERMTGCNLHSGQTE